MDTLEAFKNGITTTTPQEAEARAIELAGILPENQTLALYGDLGAGKTTFVKGLAKAWGITENVTSPTYNLFTTYSGNRNLLHLDAYRLSNAEDLEALCIEEFIKPPYCLAVEWPENVQDIIPENAWRLYFTINTDGKSHQIQLKSL